MIFVVGLNHETAPLAVREALAIGRDKLPEALKPRRIPIGTGAGAEAIQGKAETKKLKSA